MVRNGETVGQLGSVLVGQLAIALIRPLITLVKSKVDIWTWSHSKQKSNFWTFGSSVNIRLWTCVRYCRRLHRLLSHLHSHYSFLAIAQENIIYNFLAFLFGTIYVVNFALCSNPFYTLHQRPNRTRYASDLTV